MGLGEFSPWHWLIVAVVFMVLFGAKKMPDSARALGRSLRIFKSEVSGLGEDAPGQSATPPSAAQITGPAQGEPAPPSREQGSGAAQRTP
jgi:sec-independent protein translocase protein TatA